MLRQVPHPLQLRQRRLHLPQDPAEGEDPMTDAWVHYGYFEPDELDGPDEREDDEL
jgi:hypothetical protein